MSALYHDLEQHHLHHRLTLDRTRRRDTPAHGRAICASSVLTGRALVAGARPAPVTGHDGSLTAKQQRGGGRRDASVALPGGAFQATEQALAGHLRAFTDADAGRTRILREADGGRTIWRSCVSGVVGRAAQHRWWRREAHPFRSVLIGTGGPSQSWRAARVLGDRVPVSKSSLGTIDCDYRDYG